MSNVWHIELEPNGLFRCTNAVGAPLFTGTFGSEIGTPIRLHLLNLIAECESMRDMLAMIMRELDGLIWNLEQEHGAEKAREQAAGLYELRRLIAGQIRRADGLDET